MSRGVGPTADGQVWFDGYQYQGDAVRTDPRHAHVAIHPRFRSGAADLRRSLHGGFGWTSALDATPLGGLEARRGTAPGRAGGAGGASKRRKGPPSDAGEALGAGARAGAGGGGGSENRGRAGPGGHLTAAFPNDSHSHAAKKTAREPPRPESGGAGGFSSPRESGPRRARLSPARLRPPRAGPRPPARRPAGPPARRPAGPPARKPAGPPARRRGQGGRGGGGPPARLV